MRGLGDDESGELGRVVVDAILAHPGVRSVSLNHPLSRAVVDIDGPGFSLRDLCRTVEAAEKRCSERKDESVFARSLPGDGVVLATRALTVAVNATGLGIALTGRALRVRPLPAAVSASVAFVDYQPWLRRVLVNRLGGPTTDTLLMLAAAAAQTLTQSPTSLALGLTMQSMKAAEVRAEAQSWRSTNRSWRATPINQGRTQRRGRSHPFRSSGPRAVSRSCRPSAGAIGAGTRNLAMAATAVQVTTPKATRTTPEAFASTLGRGLADQHAVLPLRPESLRRLDKIDAIVIDPRILCSDTLRVARVRGGSGASGLDDTELTAAWNRAQLMLEKSSLRPGWRAVRGYPAAGLMHESKHFSRLRTNHWPRPSSPSRIAPGRN